MKIFRFVQSIIRVRREFKSMFVQIYLQ
jgi:hypothetical protein